MQDLIKSIREYTGLSQADFAVKLGVSPATVDRWENGRSIPTKATQSALYKYCKEQGVPVYRMILDRVKKAAEEIVLEKGRILLFHGSKSGIVGDIEPKSRETCDFGKGFYMGTEPEQPLTLICDFEQAKFYIVSIDTRALDIVEIKTDLDWAMLVARHRGRMEQIKGTAFYEKYSRLDAGKDLIIGSIANDRMFYVLDNFFTGVITDTALVNSLSALRLGKQYAAVTKKACAAVRIEKEIPIFPAERLFLRDESESNRQKGIKLANDICKDYRREGRFYDEILAQAK